MLLTTGNEDALALQLSEKLPQMISELYLWLAADLHVRLHEGEGMVRILICLISLIVVVPVDTLDHAKSVTTAMFHHPKQLSSSRTNSLNYVIYHNETHGEEQEQKFSRREIDILMDERCFNEENLVKLSQRLNTKYPTPANLFVSIVTSFDQIPPPDYPIASDDPENPEAAKHHRASFVRRYDLSETIRFTIDPLSKTKKTIVLREKAQ